MMMRNDAVTDGNRTSNVKEQCGNDVFQTRPKLLIRSLYLFLPEIG